MQGDAEVSHIRDGFSCPACSLRGSCTLSRTSGPFWRPILCRSGPRRASRRAGLPGHSACVRHLHIDGRERADRRNACHHRRGAGLTLLPLWEACGKLHGVGRPAPWNPRRALRQGWRPGHSQGGRCREGLERKRSTQGAWGQAPSPSAVRGCRLVSRHCAVLHIPSSAGLACQLALAATQPATHHSPPCPRAPCRQGHPAQPGAALLLQLGRAWQRDGSGARADHPRG